MEGEKSIQEEKVAGMIVRKWERRESPRRPVKLAGGSKRKTEKGREQRGNPVTRTLLNTGWMLALPQVRWEATKRF